MQVVRVVNTSSESRYGPGFCIIFGLTWCTRGWLPPTQFYSTTTRTRNSTIANSKKKLFSRSRISLCREYGMDLLYAGEMVRCRNGFREIRILDLCMRVVCVRIYMFSVGFANRGCGFCGFRCTNVNTKWIYRYWFLVPGIINWTKVQHGIEYKYAERFPGCSVYNQFIFVRFQEL